MLTDMMCDRCRQPFQGYMAGDFTAGFYLRESKQFNGYGWGIWMEEEENVVCDRCMQSDIRYIAKYGLIPKKERD